MSAVPAGWRVACDRCGRGVTITDVDNADDARREAVAPAGFRGITRHGDEDLCGPCVDALPDTTP